MYILNFYFSVVVWHYVTLLSYEVHYYQCTVPIGVKTIPMMQTLKYLKVLPMRDANKELSVFFNLHHATIKSTSVTVSDHWTLPKYFMIVMLFFIGFEGVQEIPTFHYVSWHEG